MRQQQETITLFLKALIPMLLLALGVVIFLFLNRHPPQAPAVQQSGVQLPLVQVMSVTPTHLMIPVYSRGEVTPVHQVQVAAEVAGAVVYVSPQWVSGGQFKKGDLLLKLDDRPYRLDVVRAMAQVASAQQAYRQVKVEMDSAGEIPGLPSPRKYREQRVQEALARVRAAQAEVQLANLQVAKTRLMAPFNGRVGNAIVGVGQYVAPGAQLGQIYPTDSLEVRLPLSEQQWALLDLSANAAIKTPVTLKLSFADRTYFWQGHIVRTEAGIDEHDRLLYAVAQIEHPYVADATQPDRPVLLAGQFLEADIQGHLLQNVVKLPLDVLYEGNQVWIVEQGKLKRREIPVIYKDKQWAYIQHGLVAGDRVVISPVDFAVEGMAVQTREQHE